jgi:hypothetical protein
MKKLYLVTLFACLLLGKLYAQAPVISSFNPATGPAETIVTITGKNFNATTTNNIVFFGGVKATVFSGSSTSLQVKVPVGATYKPVSILNISNHLTGYATNSFNTTFDGDHKITKAQFDPFINFPPGILPSSINIVDMDGDGKPDMVSTSKNDQFLSVYRNKATQGILDINSFDTKKDFTLNYYIYPLSAVVTDIDGDGKPDVVIGSTTNLAIFRNTSTPGNISFDAEVDFTIIGEPAGLSVADVDGDGKPDIIAAVTTTTNKSDITIFKNSAVSGVINAASFADKIIIAANTAATNMTVSDMDTDGKPDVILVNTSSNTISLIRNTSASGSVTFDNKVDFTAGSLPLVVTAGDLDGDGKPDLAVANYNDNNISVYFNTSKSGGFTETSLASQVNFATGANPMLISIMDMDGDGKPDILTANHDDPSISIFHNVSANGNITPSSFAVKQDVSLLLAGAVNLAAMGLGDLDGDSKPDMIILSDYFSVFHNNPQVVPAISNISPVSGPAGTMVTISGNGFNATPGNNVVYFGATKATVNNSTSTELKVTVPVGASYAPVSVFNAGSRLFASSRVAFTPTFTSKKSLTLADFDPKVKLAALTDVSGINFADLDGDSKPDMVVLNHNSTLSVYRNISINGSVAASSFAGKIDLPVNGEPGPVIIKDINGDGRPDLVVFNKSNFNVSYIQNNAVPGSLTTSSFAKARAINTAGGINMDIADMDGDGLPDIITTSLYNADLTITRNVSSDGQMLFATSFFLNIGHKPDALGTGDIDGDGLPDLVVGNTDNNTISILQNNSVNGNFILGNKIDIPSLFGTVSSIRLTDMNADGKPDLVLGYSEGDVVSVFLNVTTAPGQITASSFGPRLDFSLGNFATEATIADINGDGMPDIVVNDTAISALLNNTTASAVSFSGKANLLLTIPQAKANCITVFDIDGDGKPEVVYNDHNEVWALRNNPLPAVNLPDAPVVNTINPATAPVGTNIMISGANFSGNAAANAVYIGAEKGKVIAATDGQLTVQVPSGMSYKPVSVTNTSNGLTALSQVPFMNTFKTNGVIDTSSFKKIRSPDAYAPGATAIGDLDGDGKPDLILSESSGIGTVIGIFPNTTAVNKDFTFKAQVLLKSDYVTSIHLADLDGDGKLDIIANNFGPENSAGFPTKFSVYLNTSKVGDISFAEEIPLPVIATSVDFGDLNGDGKVDIVVAGVNDSQLYVLPNTSVQGKISFADPLMYGTINIQAKFSVAVADIDGDNKPELIVRYLNQASVYHNLSANGGFSFAGRENFAVAVNSEYLKIGDLNCDGKPDLVLSNTGGKNISVLVNTSIKGKISFQNHTEFAAGDDIRSINVSDLNGDGKPDVITLNASNLASVVQNTSSGNKISFAGKADYETGPSPLYFDAGDLNGDGKPDMAITCYKYSVADGPPVYSLILLKNTMKSIPTPVITADGPLSFQSGKSVTLTAKPDTGYTYQWSKNGINISAATSARLTVDKSGSYTVTISLNDETATSAPVDVKVVIPTPVITADGPLSFPSGKSVTLTAKPDTGYTYQWSKNGVNISVATSARLTVDKSGSYTVTISLNDETAISAPVVVKVIVPTPVITADGPLSFQSGKSVTLTAKPDTGYTYQWSKNGINISAATSTRLTVDKSGSYTVTISLNDETAISAPVVVKVIVPTPVITPDGPLSFPSGKSVTLTAKPDTGYTYQWSKNGIIISAATNATLIVNKSGSYTVNISLSDETATSAPVVVNEVFTLPDDNFKVAVTAASCKGSNNGSISITAVQPLKYSAVVSGGDVNGTYPFTTTQKIDNLRAGTYNVCITVEGHDDYKQCFSVVVKEPKDLSLLSTVDNKNSLLTLQMDGGENYNIQLNGNSYTTPLSKITLALSQGKNDLIVSTDKNCQGIIKKIIMVDATVVYPVPFSNVLNIDQGIQASALQRVSIYNVFGKKVYEANVASNGGKIKLDVSSFAQGGYILKINGNDTAYKIWK